MSGTTVARSHAGFQHEALLYADHDDFIAAAAPFVADGVAADEPVLVVLGPERTSALRDALGPTTAAVQFVDMAVLGANPARIIPAWRAFVDGTRPGRPRRGIGEPIWPGRSRVEVVECQRHEALLNVAFEGGASWTLMCPYDVSALDDDVIDEARRSHPTLRAEGDRRASTVVRGIDMAAAFLADPLPDPPASSTTRVFGPADVRDVRDFVAAHVVASDLAATRGFDLMVAASEIATNSLRYGGGRGTIRIWYDTTELVCEFSDTGRLTEPLAGRQLPGPDQEGRRGLWLANQLCDLVQIRVFDRGTVVRLHVNLNTPRPQSAVEAY